MTWPLKQRWFWILFFFLLSVLVVPVLVVGLIFSFSPNALIVVLIVLVVVWIVVRSHRDARKERETAG